MQWHRSLTLADVSFPSAYFLSRFELKNIGKNESKTDPSENAPTPRWKWGPSTTLIILKFESRDFKGRHFYFCTAFFESEQGCLNAMLLDASL